MQSFGCPETYSDVTDVSWECEYDYLKNNRTASDYLVDPFAVPDVWWSDAQGLLGYETLAAERGLNPWEALGTGGDTVMMKMVFTLTRERRRHTFMVSAMKTTMLALAGAKIQIGEVRDLVERTWRVGDGAALLEHDVDAVGKLVEGGMTGLMMGRQHSDGYKVTSRVYSLLAPFWKGTPSYTAFQILDANITLVNSETVDVAPKPFEDCDTWYRNDAYAGVVTGSNCYIAERDEGKTRRFQGQADTLAVFVLQGALGKKRAGTAADALNDEAWRWVQENNELLENLVLSRAYIISGNGGAVKIDVNILRPALSLLQIVLAALPLLWFVVSWGVVLGWVAEHYQVSLLTNLIATTHDGHDGANPNFMAKVPKMGLVMAGGKVYLGTETGVFLHSGRNEEWEGLGEFPALRQKEKHSYGNPVPV